MKLRRWSVARLFILVSVIFLTACGAADDAARALPSVIDDAGRALPSVIDDAGRALPSAIDDASLVAKAIADDAALMVDDAALTADDAIRLVPVTAGATARTAEEQSLLRELLKKVACVYLQDSSPDEIVHDVQTLFGQHPTISPLSAAWLQTTGRDVAAQFRSQNAADPFYVAAVTLYCA